MPPSELDKMFYYDMQYMLEAYIKIVEERNKKEKEESQSQSSAYKMPNYKAPKIPSMNSSFKMPKY